MDFSISLGGLNQASANLNQAAAKIARAGGSSQNPDTLDLSASMVALLQARQDFSSNAKVIQTVDEMNKALLKAIG